MTYGEISSSLTYVKLEAGVCLGEKEKYLKKYLLKFSKFNKKYKPIDQRSSMNLKEEKHKENYNK